MTKFNHQLIMDNDLLLRKIFSFMEPDEIKTAMLVCR